MVTEAQTLATIQQRDALRQVLLFPTPGNLVNVGVELYRQDFKTYVKLAASAYLWILVPVYGWAKFLALSALISRLAYWRLLGQPEDLAHSRTSVSGGKMWRFLTLAFLVGFLYLAGYMVLAIGAIIVTVALGFALVTVAVPTFGENIGAVIVGGIVAIVAMGVLAIGLLWLGARLSIPDTVLVIEGHQAADRGIGRSWNLSQGNVIRLTVVISTTFTIVLPVLMFTNYLPSILPIFVAENTSLYVIANIGSFAFSILSGILTLPLWQCIKAVVYCDLRMRREGVDLTLRDHELNPADHPEEPTDAIII